MWVTSLKFIIIIIIIINLLSYGVSIFYFPLIFSNFFF